MMIRVKNKKIVRILSLLLAVAVVWSSFAVALSAFAAEPFKVILTDGSEVLDSLEDIKVTLINKNDTTDTASVETVSGIASFENFLVAGETYLVSVSDVFGFEPFDGDEFTADSSTEEFRVVLNQLEKTTVTGILENEQGYECASLDLKYSGYTEGSVKTEDNGSFSFEAYVGKSYTVSFEGNDEYQASSITIPAITEDYECEDFVLNYNTFTVSAAIDGGGKVTPSEPDIKYGFPADIVFEAEEHYRIESITINGNPVDDVKDLKTYTHKIESVTANVDITAKFYRVKYSVKVTYGENGKIYEAQFDENGEVGDIGEESVVVNNGGIISFNEGDKAGFVATANEFYHISSVIVNGSEVENLDYTNDFNKFSYVFTENKNHEVQVDFAINTHIVSVKSDDNGVVTIENNTVNHGEESSLITISENEGYVIDKILIKTASNSEGVALTEDDKEDYSFTFESDFVYSIKLPSVTEDTEVEAVFRKIPETNADWREQITVTSEEGALVSEAEDADGNCVYVFKAGSQVTVSPKDADSKIRINNNISYSKDVKLDKSFVIDSFTLFELAFCDNKFTNKLDGKKIIVVIDTVRPVISDIEQMKEWSKENEYTISSVATDLPGENDNNIISGVSYIVWSRGESLDSFQVLEAGEENRIEVNDDGTFNFTVTGAHNDERYYFYAVDKAGNVSEAKTVDVKIDLNDPEVVAFYFDEIGKSAGKELINFFSFGTLFNETISVSVEFIDPEITSGVYKVYLYSEAHGDNPEQNVVAVLTLNKDGTVDKKESDSDAKLVDGKAVFDVTEEEFNNMKIAACVEDYSGRKSKITKPTQVKTEAKSDNLVIDSSDAFIEIIRDTDTDGIDDFWYSEDVNFVVNISAKDYVGINSVKVTLNGQELATDLSEEPKVVNQNYAQEVEDENGNVYNTFTEELSFKFSTSQIEIDETIEATGKYVLEVVAKTNTTQVVSKSETVYIDRTRPDVSNFEFESKGETAIENVYNYLTFGVFFNEKLAVSVSAIDEKASSGLKEITIYADEEPYATAEVVDGIAVFDIPIEDIVKNRIMFDAQLSAKAVDNVGNETELFILPSDVNSNIKDDESRFMIETISPSISIVKDNAVYIDEEDRQWYSEDVSFEITVGDTESGLRSVEISINDTLINDDKNEKPILQNYYRETEALEEETFTISTDQVEAAEDGSYTLKVVVIDNAGNSSEDVSELFIDPYDPYITMFDFMAEKYVEGSETSLTVEETDYGFYFAQDTNVTIYSADDEPSSGINTITYYTVDIEKGQSDPKTVKVDSENSVGLTVPANFKGQIYAKASDNVQNEKSDFVNPNSAILESKEKHETEAHFSFTKPQATFATQAGGELYAQSVPVTVTVIDTYSGIREIEWFVEAPFDKDNNAQGKVTVDNAANLTGDSGWQITQKEKNIATQMQKQITVNNNSNDIVVRVVMTDRAGNQSEESTTFSIDMTAPEITIVYDNNTPDPTYNHMYMADREATITVKERNFNSEEIVHSITNTDGIVPALSSWTEYSNTSNPDETYHVATVRYSADGDYTFDISYSDRAGNPANTIPTHQFTIDKTEPVITVTYDNNSSRNGYYYDRSRTATITVHEHNFDSSRIQITGSATDGGSSVTFPAASSWSSAGDVHTANIRYSQDAEYKFDIAMNDMAGNASADVAEDSFIVDKTAPVVTISGVANMSANSGKVAPVITSTDTNFDYNSVRITLVGANNGSVNYAGSFNDIENGQRFAYANFEEKQEVDDLYTLSATVTDLAGNSSLQVIRFSANRFGSVYAFDDSLKEIAGSYIVTERDIVFTETNVDVLTRDSIKVKLVKNGAPTDLVEGEDYDIVATGGNGAWSQYRYIVHKNLFAADGRYSVSVYSVDAAGNINQNTDEIKKAEITFGVDKTSPVIVPVDFESGEQYDVENKTVSIEIKDNLVMGEVKIYLNGTQIDYTNDGDVYTFSIPEMNEKQNVRIVTLDAAGNEKEILVDDFLVSTNSLVRWYNNTPLFVGTIIGAAALIIGGVVLVLFVVKKRKEDY